MFGLMAVLHAGDGGYGRCPGRLTVRARDHDDGMIGETGRFAHKRARNFLEFSVKFLPECDLAAQQIWKRGVPRLELVRGRPSAGFKIITEWIFKVSLRI